MGAAEKRIDDEWLTTTEAAAYAKMKREAFKAHLHRGSLRPDSPARPGFRCHRFLRSSIDRWLKGEP